jgi:hypothetical protein
VPVNDVLSGGETNARRSRVRTEESIYKPTDEGSVAPYCQNDAVVSAVGFQGHIGSGIR